MVQAIIFDCFGVLATDGWLPFKRQYFASDHQKYEAVSELNKQADAGLITHNQFLEAVAELAEVEPSVVSRAVRANVPDPELFTYIQELKPDYKIGLLSNTAGDWLQHIFNDEQLALFDAKVLSYNRGFVKPQAAAYQAIADELNVPLEACIFIDDQERHVSGAIQVGMPALIYKGVAQLRRELEVLLKDTDN